MPHQIVSTLPDAIPVPKFSLFQKVRRKADDAALPAVGTVVGLEFVSFPVALHSNWSTMGWEYKVDWLYETEPIAALKIAALRDQSCESFYENELEAIEAL